MSASHKREPGEDLNISYTSVYVGEQYSTQEGCICVMLLTSKSPLRN